jgi:hypothetical protein
MHLQVVELVVLLMVLHLPLLAETHSPLVECHPPILFKVVTEEKVHRSARDLPFQVKMEMQIQSLELHTNLVPAAVVADGMPTALLAVATLVARAAQTLLLVDLVATSVPVAVVQVRLLGLAVMARLES